MAEFSSWFEEHIERARQDDKLYQMNLKDAQSALMAFLAARRLNAGWRRGLREPGNRPFVTPLFCIIYIISENFVAAAHSKLGCDKSPILLKSKENGHG
ncbi:hypothetical protein PXK00_18510, partial [Phaeobacter sp. QD34_3]|uniref:hypothetical protein n=1 Tax=unclassified Phaeobacter TaxID=2621772 RepID=UPI00237F340E